MRHTQCPQLVLGQTPFEDIEIEWDSRDDIPKILAGLKHVQQDEERREAILWLIARDFAQTAALDNGAPGHGPVAGVRARGVSSGSALRL